MFLQDHKSNLGASAHVVSRRSIAGGAAGKTISSSLFEISKNVVRRVGRHNLSLVAAGVAFYAMTAIFPAIAALVSVYGLFGDPRAIEQQIASYSDLLPTNSLKLLTDALENFAGKSNSTSECRAHYFGRFRVVEREGRGIVIDDGPEHRE